MATQNQSSQTKPDFQQIQDEFSHYLRDPNNAPAPSGIEARRIDIYKNLVYRNAENLFSGGFPVLKKIVGAKDWQLLVRGFLIRHRSHTPYFTRLAEEFILYLKNESEHKPLIYPFMLELAHYEALETSIIFDPRVICEQGINRSGNPLKDIPVLNPLIITCGYDWPVHKISPDYLPLSPPGEKTYLLLYRNRDHQHGFVAINQMTAKLIEKLQQESQCTGETLLHQIASELKYPNPSDLIKAGSQIVQQFLEKEILLGVRD